MNFTWEVEQMIKRFIRPIGLTVAFAGLSIGTAAAQTYNTPAPAVISAEVTQQVSTAVASTLASGVAGAVAGSASVAAPVGAPTGVNTSDASPINPTPVTKLFAAGNRGSNAGAKDKRFGIWLLGSYSDIESNKLDADFDGDIVNFVGGADYRLTNKIIAGVAVSYEAVDVDTGFNNGTFENDGIGITPYVVFALNKNITFDINGSWTTLNNDTTRANNTIIGSFDSDRYTAGANLTFSHSVKKFFMSATAGFLYIKEDQDGFTESNGTVVAANEISIGQGRIGATVGYNAGKWQPWVSLRAENEFWAPSDVVSGNGNVIANDTFGLVVGAGVNFTFSDAVSGGVSFTTTEARDDLDLYTITGRLRVNF